MESGLSQTSMMTPYHRDEYIELIRFSGQLKF